MVLVRLGLTESFSPEGLKKAKKTKPEEQNSLKCRLEGIKHPKKQHTIT